jgi:hypothetical protein
MQKLLVSFLLLLVSSYAWAAPTLTADPYPATGIQPTAASVTVNGATPISCSLVTSANGLVPTCDLASITAPGTYTLVLSVTTQAGCLPPVPNAATCSGAGVASSTPFAYTWTGSVARIPVLRVSP